MVKKTNNAALVLEGDGALRDAVILDEKIGPVQHKDMGLIQATELDGITINRTKTKISPFIEIRKERLVDQLTGAPSKAFGIWVPDPGAEGGWKDMGTVSENYLLLTNKEVRELALEIATQSGLPFKESRIFWDGAKFCHVVDFLERESVEDGDEVGLSLITRSSYDKSWRFEAALMGKRFACDNGCLSGEFFARVSFRHSAGSSKGALDPGKREGVGLVEENWKEIVKQGLSVVDHAPENLRRFVQGLRLLKKAELTDQRLREVWKMLPGIGDGIMGKIMARYVTHEEPTLYGFFQAGTNVFWHNQKMTSADFQNNDQFVTGLLGYAFDAQN